MNLLILIVYVNIENVRCICLLAGKFKSEFNFHTVVLPVIHTSEPNNLIVIQFDPIEI